jgi:hypothetical protein
LPNIKIYVNESVLTVRKPELIAALEPLREMIIGHLDVPKSACQLAIVSIVGLEDEPALNVEMHVMPGGKRTQKSLEALGAAIQGMLNEATGSKVAFRCAQLDPGTYVTLK